MSKQQFYKAVARLRQHHSRDQIALTLITSKMNTSMQAWRCATCMKVCGKTHQYCGVCGKSWHLCADPTFGTNNAQRQVQWSYTAGWEPEADWEDQQWQQQRPPSWSKSPRRRQTPRRRPNRRNGQKAETETAQSAKGKGKTQLADPPIGPPPLPSMSPGDTPWLTPLAQAPQQVTNHPVPNPEEKQLKTLMAMLKKHNETLPPEVQAMLNDAEMKDGHAETKQLHSAVAAHGRAKRDLQQARLAHFHLHAAWRGFLTQAVAQWKGYSDQFVEQEKQLTDRVQKAMEALEQARETLATTKSAAGVESREDAMSDEETDKTTKEVNSNAADKIKEGITNLHTSLGALRSSADQRVEDEQKALKRPRLDGVRGESSNALPPDGPNFG